MYIILLLIDLLALETENIYPSGKPSCLLSSGIISKFPKALPILPRVRALAREYIQQLAGFRGSIPRTIAILRIFSSKSSLVALVRF